MTPGHVNELAVGPEGSKWRGKIGKKHTYAAVTWLRTNLLSREIYESLFHSSLYLYYLLELPVNKRSSGIWLFYRDSHPPVECIYARFGNIYWRMQKSRFSNSIGIVNWQRKWSETVSSRVCYFVLKIRVIII